MRKLSNLIRYNSKKKAINNIKTKKKRNENFYKKIVSVRKKLNIQNKINTLKEKKNQITIKKQYYVLILKIFTNISIDIIY